MTARKPTTLTPALEAGPFEPDLLETATEGVFTRGRSSDRGARLIVGDIDLGVFRQLQRGDGYVLTWDIPEGGLSGEVSIRFGHPSDLVVLADWPERELDAGELDVYLRAG
jgi:hypothetical protein